MYKTKTQKKRALIAMDQKARYLYMSQVLTINDFQKVTEIVNRASRKL